MAVQKNSIWWALALMLSSMPYALANQTPVIRVKNDLASCIRIEKPIIYTAEGILLAKISYLQKKSILACGCKSTASTFTSQGGKTDDNILLMKGNFSFEKTGEINLPLNMNQLPIPSNNIKLKISCAT